MSIYFRLLTEDAYVQTGNYTLSELYNENGGDALFYNEDAPSTQAMPSTFAREWATITKSGYDWGAYGTGVKVDTATVTLPSVARRSLLYMYDIRSTAERRTLVETASSAADLVSQGVIASDGVVVFNTFEEYVENFVQAGRYDFGGTGTPVLPAGMSVSQVSELYSYNATIDGVNLDASDVAQPVQVYVSPTWLGNERPLFDQVYFADDLVKNANGVYAINAYQGKPLRQVRWFGGVPSENIAQINRAGDALNNSNSSYNYTDTVVESGIVEDGQTYTNADAYNVTNLKRQ